MSAMSLSSTSISNAWDVFLLFAIPIGGGIPAGVILAKSRGFSWQIMTFLYFISDVLLACAFEPTMKLFVYAGKKYPPLGKANETIKNAVHKTISKYGVNPGPILLVTIAFGTDPMTGRAATRMAGHGFISGWALAILGDLFFYALIMISTLMLNNILGDGTATAVIIMVLMMFVPVVIRKMRRRPAT
jgi:uncharacterized membrane protein